MLAARAGRAAVFEERVQIPTRNRQTIGNFILHVWTVNQYGRRWTHLNQSVLATALSMPIRHGPFPQWFMGALVGVEAAPLATVPWAEDDD